MIRGLVQQLVAAPLAFAGVLAFFLGLGWIIGAPEGDPGSRPERISLNWAQLEPEPDIETLQPPPPPPPELTQPETATQVEASASQVAALDSDFIIEEPLPDLQMEPGFGEFPDLNPNLAQVSAAPVHREQPQYPRRALSRRIEGWVELAFAVDAQGRVQAETIRVIAAQPEGIFDRAARRAIARWRFSSDELGSQGAELRQRLEFRLEGDG